MARIIQTGSGLSRQLSDVPPEARLWVYCGFDACTPQEILPQVKDLFDEQATATYDFERTMQGPALSMMLTGVPVDEAQLVATIADLEAQERDLSGYVRSLFVAFWGEDVSPASPAQMADFFYHNAEGLGLTPRYTKRKKGSSVSTDRNALESIANEYYYAKPLVAAILEVKDLRKRLEFLRRGVDSDRRVRCSFSPAATETGRWSSSKNPWGRGGNFQNQTEEIRKIYVPDESRIFVAPDLKQAESFGVAYLSGDPKYLAALLSGDLHTTVAKLVWPSLEWPGDNGSGDRAVAETSFYRHFSHRDMSKRGGHASNYLGSAREVARNIKVPTEVMEHFQHDYFDTFCEIPKWHREVQTRLQSEGFLVSPLGRKRTFFGRLFDNSTLKEAVASLPQGLISDIFKIGLYRIWQAFEAPWGQDPKRPVCLYADVHDGGLIGVRADMLDELAPQMIRFLTVPVQMPYGVMTIPVEFKVGWHWQKKEMVEWEPGVISRLGPRPDVSAGLLDLDASLFTSP